VIGDWTSRRYEEHYQSIGGQKQVKGFLGGGAGKLLSLNRNQRRIVTGFLTGHWHSKGLLFKLRIVNSPECDRWKLATERASPILCDWGLYHAKFQVTGSLFYETRWFWGHICWQDNARCSRRLAVDAWAKGLHKRSIMVEVQGSLLCLPFCMLFSLKVLLSVLSMKCWLKM